MKTTPIYHRIAEAAARGQKLLAVLVDPDKFDPNHFAAVLRSRRFAEIDYVLVGGSFLSHHTDSCIAAIKELSDKPVILFPGNACHVGTQADAILLLSLISGRNAEFLIGNHVTAAPFLKKSGIETISTGYMLIGNGNNTSVEYISNTRPIPAGKTDIATATAIAGEMLGMKLIYLEAGSGASQPVPDEMIRAISSACSCPVIVGGGIGTRDEMQRKFAAGASMVVVGTALE